MVGEHNCIGCKEVIDKKVYCIIRQGSGLSKNKKRYWFSSRYHLGCFAEFLLTEVEQKETNKGKGAGRPSFLSHLTVEEKRLRTRTNGYLNYRDKRNLIQFYEENNRPRILDTWYLIAERIKVLAGFDAPFNLPWRDDEVALLITRNDTNLAFRLADKSVSEFPEIIWNYVRENRE